MAISRFYIAVIGFFLAALIFGVLYFITGMGDASYLVSDGLAYGLHYVDKPRYDSNLQGLIFTLTFLAAGLLLLVLAILPSEEILAAGGISAAPQPRRRSAAAPAKPAKPQSRATAAPAAPAPQARPAPAEEPKVAVAPVEIEPDDPKPAPPPKPKAAPKEPERSVEEEVLISAADEDSMEDVPDSRYDESGEENVVYGSGRVNDDSVWDFIHSYPDSAVKFLYRKSLENKPLSPTDEDIYRRWEIRGMSRGKVRELVLETMGWKSLPDDLPHNIWRLLRDQIFEMKSRAA